MSLSADDIAMYQPKTLPKPRPPHGVKWGLPSPTNPYVEGLPIVAWLSWQMQSAGVPEEDPVAAALLEAIVLARGDGGPEYVMAAVEGAVRHYCEMVATMLGAPDSTP